MPNLKEVRNRISSVVSTQQITKAMKMVAAAKLKRATDAIIQMRPYANKLRDILGNLSASLEDHDNVFTREREPRQVLLLVITSNRGLAGSFNSNVIKATSQLIAGEFKEHQNKGALHLVCIGKKGQDHFRKHGYQVAGDHNEVFNDLRFETSLEVIQGITRDYAKGKYDRVVMVYNQFKNAAVQILTTEQLLPVPRPEVPAEKKEENVLRADYILEPSREEIVEELIPRSLQIQFYKALLDSHAAEHGARMTAMDKATDNAGELLKTLRLQYNRARQAAITNEILEIVSGANALAAED